MSLGRRMLVDIPEVDRFSGVTETDFSSSHSDGMYLGRFDLFAFISPILLQVVPHSGRNPRRSHEAFVPGSFFRQDDIAVVHGIFCLG